MDTPPEGWGELLAGYSTAITPTLTVPRAHRSIPSEETPVRAILTALTAILLFLPCSVYAQSVLRIGLNDDPDALDPTISRAYTGRLVFAALCDKLFDVTPDLKIVPQLATGHEWAADRKSIVIKLRPGVRFQDGEPFNAEAVRFNIERHQNTPGSFRKTEIGDIQSVDVVNDLTVRLNLSQPLVPLLASTRAPASSTAPPATRSATCSASGSSFRSPGPSAPNSRPTWATSRPRTHAS
jgi:peptide/nickel transport system substrate-binding protein